MEAVGANVLCFCLLFLEGTVDRHEVGQYHRGDV